MSNLKQTPSLRKPTIRQTLITGFTFIFGFILLALMIMPAWEYTNSVAFCSDTCHAVHPEEPAAFQDSYHARVKCTECHMGRVSTLEALVLKSSHFKHLPAMLSGQYSRPVESKTMRPANESCERCHWPPAFHGDTVRQIKHFQPDENSTLKSTYLILKTGGGERTSGLGYGIHWHIENKVEYIAADEHKQDIRWVRTTLPDGRTVEYNDVLNPVSPEEIKGEKIRVMDCVDCHNRVGHPFPYPEQAIDNAIADNRISRSLPFIKKEMVDLLNVSYPDQAAALSAVETIRTQYVAAYPDVADTYAPQIEQATQTSQQLVSRLVFERPGISWRSFPDNGRHKEFAGCFRCHDGEHLSSEGESIRLHCNICHSLPIIVGEGDRAPSMPVATVHEPESHLQTNFMADHRFQASQECSACHGEIKFGVDNSNFCANSACHGQAWPSIELDAAFPHPIKLEGEHVHAWCNDCHAGVAKPEYKCANCHQPPENHFAPPCETCHNPQGWKESAVLVTAKAPRISHTKQGRDQCLVCHDPISGAIKAPAGHTGFENAQCVLCHK